MQISEILERKNPWIHQMRPQQSALEAVAVMVDHQVGAVVVAEHGQILGVITERDILKTLRNTGKNPAGQPVAELMTHQTLSITPQEEVDYTLQLMTRNHLHHLPVVEKDRIVGIVTLADLVKASHNACRFENRMLKHYIQAWPEGAAA